MVTVLNRFHPIWTQLFFGSNNQFLLLDHCCPSQSTKSEKYKDSKSRKCPKTPDLGQFGPILANFGPGHFRTSGIVTYSRLTWCKNQKNLMVVTMRTLRDWLTTSNTSDGSHRPNWLHRTRRVQKTSSPLGSKYQLIALRRYRYPSLRFDWWLCTLLVSTVHNVIIR